MPVSSWSSTAASNTAILSGLTLDGSVMTVGQLDNAFRDMAAQIAAQLGKLGFKGADMASASTTNLANATGWYIDVTGTTAISAFGTVDAGQMFILRFTGALTLTYNASSLILPGGIDISTSAGDVAFMMSLGSGNWRCVVFQGFTGSLAGHPSVSTDNAIARYDGALGALQNSGISISDTNVVTGGAWNGTVGATTPATGAFTTVTASGNITGNSDIRLKTDIEQIDDAYEILRRIRGVRFTRISDGTRNFGVVAQELLKAGAPEMVREGDEGFLAVDYGSGFGLVAAAFNRMADTIERQEARLATLEGR